MEETVEYKSLNVKVKTEQLDALNEILKHGDRIELFSALIDGVILAHGTYGRAAIHMIKSGRISLYDATNLDKVKENATIE